ncbi:MAG TPA: leishmanolysin-related zinc metalloendopeptidase, partial [Microthrixaceae bacterium]|nr:leishmanolysin-related zinc metalloendopeptidase [Microthrixaceae bacterium]
PISTDGLVVNGVLRSVTKKLDITIAPGPSEPFDITLIGVDSLDAAVAAEFSAAAAKWEQVITTGLPDIDGSTLGCTPEEGRPIPASIDDLAIYTEVVPIDGVGGTLGSAGPTCMVRATELGVIGIMQFDEADVASMLSNGTLRSVILHEMGHVLGIGTLWDTSFASGARHLLSGAGSADPRFLGTAAGSEWGLLGGTSTVPVENTGGPGTADSHWRETIFTTELMTGWMNSGAQMSAMTIASLADLGYHVDMSQAEPFQLNPGAGAVARWSNLLQPSLTMLRPPIQVG